MRTSGARVLSLKSMKKVFDLKSMHPIVDKLLFLQMLPREDDEREYKLYPCYLVGAAAKSKNSDEIDRITVDVVCVELGQHSVLRTNLPVSSMGKQWQIWREAPTDMAIHRHKLTGKRLPAKVKEEEEKKEEKGEANDVH